MLDVGFGPPLGGGQVGQAGLRSESWARQATRPLARGASTVRSPSPATLVLEARQDFDVASWLDHWRRDRHRDDGHAAASRRNPLGYLPRRRTGAGWSSVTTGVTTSYSRCPASGGMVTTRRVCVRLVDAPCRCTPPPKLQGARGRPAGPLPRLEPGAIRCPRHTPVVTGGDPSGSR